MKTQLKTLVVLGTATAMLASSVFSVSAAGMRDVFDAKYYADTYKDLQEAFGDDSEALYQHFLDNGLKENRQMSPIIDVQAYRAGYPDLEAAFGDDWDAYVEHFFDNGAKEGRTKGVLFNPVKYAEAYPDIAAAFGDDIRAIVQHYLTTGMKEGRTAGVVAKETSAPSSGGGSSHDSGSTPNTGDNKKPPVTPPPAAPGNPDYKEPTAATPTKTVETLTISGGDITGVISASVDSKTIASTGITAGSAAAIKASVSGQLADTNKDVVSLTIDATGVSDAKGVQAAIPKEVIAALKEVDASGTRTAVTVVNEAATVTMPLKAIQTAQGGDADKSISINVTSLSTNDVGEVDVAGATLTDVSGNVVSTANAVFMKIELKDGASAVSIPAGSAGEIQVTVPANGMKGKVNVYFVNGSNALELVGTADVEGENITFAVDHLTKFVIVERKHSIDVAAHSIGMFDKDGNCQFCATVTLKKLQEVCTDADHTTTASPAEGNCPKCGKEKTHSHTEAWVNTDANEHWKKCSVCGEVIANAKARHNFGDNNDTACACGKAAPSNEPVGPNPNPETPDPAPAPEPTPGTASDHAYTPNKSGETEGDYYSGSDNQHWKKCTWVDVSNNNAACTLHNKAEMPDSVSGSDAKIGAHNWEKNGTKQTTCVTCGKTHACAEGDYLYREVSGNDVDSQHEKYCKVCGKVAEKTNHTEPAKNASEAKTPWTEVNDGKTHTAECIQKEKGCTGKVVGNCDNNDTTACTTCGRAATSGSNGST